MATRCGQFAVGQLRTLYQLGTIGDRSDRQLLEQFLIGEAERAELAFEALVQRHGPMVQGVCAALLRNPHDAQDAFQATFLVLLRKARVLWIHDSLGPWLHRVAKRVAVRVQVSARRRRAFERRAADSKIALLEPPGHDGRWTILALHEEIDRLPQRYRAPVVLCHLEGQSHELAAKTLRLPVGTIKSRLHRARDLLRGRLSRRGVAFSASLLTAEIAASAANAGISLPLLTPLLRASARAGMPRAGECGVSPRTVHLVEEAITTMFLTRIRIGVAITLLAACLAAGAAGVFAGQGAGPETRATSTLTPARTAGPGIAPPGQSPAPSYIRQSRKMIVERLEQELAVAQERLDRTSRRERDTNDPALVRARKTADTLAGLVARIDKVLVDAVDEFPTMFDFSNAEPESPAGPKAESNQPRTAATKSHLELSVSEAKRMIEMDQTTTFYIRLRNHGTVDATNIQVHVRLSANLEALNTTAAFELPAEIASQNRAIKFHRIERLGSGKETRLGIRVRAVGSPRLLGTCRVAVTYDGLSGALEEIAGVKLTLRMPTTPTAAAVGTSADHSAKTTAEPAAPNPDDGSDILSYDEHALARAAEILEWSTKMHEKGYISKAQSDSDRRDYQALKSRIDADIARAADRVDWAKRMFEKGYVTKTQYDAEILKHYDALKARKEGPAVSDEILEQYDHLKQQIPAKPAGKDPDKSKTGTSLLPPSPTNAKDGSQPGKTDTPQKPATASQPKE